MDPIKRDLVIRLRWIKALKSPLEEEERRTMRVLGLREKSEASLERLQRKALRDRWREAQRMGRDSNRQEVAEHRRRVKELTEIKAKRAEAMGWVKGFGQWGMSTAMWGGAIGLGLGGMLTKGFIDEAKAAQNEWLGMTTLINSADSMVSGPLADVNAAFRESKVLLEQLREAAAATPGTFDDINTAFRDMVIPARMTGAAYKDIIKLASDASTMTRVLGYDQGTISRDVMQLLRGDIAGIQTPQLKAIRMEVSKLVRGGKGSQALGVISNALSVPDPVMTEYSNSFEAMWATLTDEWKAFAREAGKPVLDWLSKELKDALKWINANRDAVKEWAKALGEDVKSGLIWIRDALRWMIENREDIIGWAKWLAGAAGLAVAVTAINGVVTGIKTMIGLAPALGTALTKSLGPIMALAAFMGANLFEDKNMFEVYGYGFEALGNAGTGQGRDWFFGANSDSSKTAKDRMKELRDLKALEQAGENALNVRRVGGKGTRGSRAMPGDPDFMPFQIMDASGNPLKLKRDGAGFFDAIGDTIPKDMNITPITNIDARGSRVTIHQKVETDNPAAIARASLLAGFEAVAKHPIRARTRPGSVRLANGDGE